MKFYSAAIEMKATVPSPEYMYMYFPLSEYFPSVLFVTLYNVALMCFGPLWLKMANLGNSNRHDSSF